MTGSTAFAGRARVALRQSVRPVRSSCAFLGPRTAPRFTPQVPGSPAPVGGSGSSSPRKRPGPSPRVPGPPAGAAYVARSRAPGPLQSGSRGSSWPDPFALAELAGHAVAIPGAAILPVLLHLHVVDVAPVLAPRLGLAGG